MIKWTFPIALKAMGNVHCTVLQVYRKTEYKNTLLLNIIKIHNYNNAAK